MVDDFSIDGGEGGASVNIKYSVVQHTEFKGDEEKKRRREKKKRSASGWKKTQNPQVVGNGFLE
jgi:hypothetical protein